jgi:hypothetical protein
VPNRCSRTSSSRAGLAVEEPEQVFLRDVLHQPATIFAERQADHDGVSGRGVSRVVRGPLRLGSARCCLAGEHQAFGQAIRATDTGMLLRAVILLGDWTNTIVVG